MFALDFYASWRGRNRVTEISRAHNLIVKQSHYLNQLAREFSLPYFLIKSNIFFSHQILPRNTFFQFEFSFHSLSQGLQISAFY